MNPLDIIEIPGYPGWYARRAAVWAWQAAGSPPLVSAGRLYADQKYLYDGFLARKPGFNPADNPDDETLPLAHCRFVAFDLKNPERDRGAMIRAGFRFPYSYERWHGELPNVRSYGIVRSIPTLTTANAQPLTIATKGIDMSATLLTSSGGQNFILDGEAFALTPDDVRSITGAQVVAVPAGLHYAILQRLQRTTSNAALPVIVYVRDNDGTVYILEDGNLRALVDPSTLAALHAQGAASITLSRAEADNLLHAA